MSRAHNLTIPINNDAAVPSGPNTPVFDLVSHPLFDSTSVVECAEQEQEREEQARLRDTCRRHEAALASRCLWSFGAGHSFVLFWSRA